MDWIHCNSCFIQPGDIDTTTFFITNCGHIYCNGCLELNKSSECRICRIKFITIALKANMNSEVEMYFHDPIANIKKQIKVLEFQQTHRVRLVSQNRDRIRNYKAVKKENHILRQDLKHCKEVNASLLDENKNLKAALLEFRKKHELSANGDQSRSPSKSPQLISFSQNKSKDIRRTPPHKGSQNIYRRDNLDERSFNPNLRHIPNSNFFLTVEPKQLEKDRKGYTTPEPHRFPGSYRCNRTLTPDSNSPPTPKSVVSDYTEMDPLMRRDKYSESRSGQSPSPTSRLRFHGLSLSRSSTPVTENSPTNKYLKYFK